LVDRERGKSEKESNTMPQTKPAYTEQFKREVLAHLASTGQTLTQTAAHFGMSANSLREWKRRAGAPLGALPSVVSMESPQAELRRLRKENRELQMRCEILKKTVVIFSGPPSSDMGRSSK
jgi:transposase